MQDGVHFSPSTPHISVNQSYNACNLTFRTPTLKRQTQTLGTASKTHYFPSNNTCN